MDVRGLGASDTPSDGCDLSSLAADAVVVLDALQIEQAAIVGIDLGSAIAWMTAMQPPSRITRPAVMEGLLGALAGAEGFFAGGPPWWFAFHAVSGLVETVLAGNVAEHLDFFYRSGTHAGGGIAEAPRAAFVESHGDPRHLRCGFAHHRALADNGRRIAEAAAEHEIGMPVLALGAGTVGDALRQQLESITDDLSGTVIPAGRAARDGLSPDRAGAGAGAALSEHRFGRADPGGYRALAPALYRGRGRRCVVATNSASRSGRGPAIAEITTTAPPRAPAETGGSALTNGVGDT